MAGGRPYVFQQDGAPAHNAKSTQTWLSDNLLDFWGKEVRPPSSPYCNPLDYYVWGACERTNSRSPHNTLTSLKKAIMSLKKAIMDARLLWLQIQERVCH